MPSLFSESHLQVWHGATTGIISDRSHCRTSLHSHGPLFRLCRARQTKILLSWGAALIATGSGVLKSQRKPGSLSAHSWATLLLLSNRVCTHWPRRTTRKSLNISYQKERSSKKRSTKESSPKKRCQTRTRRDRSSDRLVVIIPIHSSYCFTIVCISATITLCYQMMCEGDPRSWGW